ncbi:UNVERIFIED_CONTAM: Bidirectional sugar transporter SWEET17 [Sesamum latifolium]|uniref:Bidirectional sugar transporter SWEET17 n=1 Tax=Sesamum latifolium TaxID=2727402 RepID=A0AAW2UYU9_9LAMI
MSHYKNLSLSPGSLASLYCLSWKNSEFRLLRSLVCCGHGEGSLLGNIISLLVFLSPARTFVRIVKNKSTEEFESFPYICTLLSSSLWTYYGLTKPDTFLVATVNGFGVALEIVYVSLFLFFAPPPIRVKTGVLFGIMNVGFLGAAVWMTYMLLDGEVRIDAIGLMCSALTIIMYTSPLSAMFVYVSVYLIVSEHKKDIL